MAIPLTLRTIKGSKLTFAELDQNFISLRNAINTATSSDTFVTGGTYNPPTTSLDFYGNGGFNPFSVNVSGLLDTFVSGGTYNPTTGCATFVTNSGTTFDVCGFLTGATGTAEVVWTGGSAGNYSVKQITDTTTDATVDYAVAIGRDTRASALASFAGGRNSVAAGQYSFAFGVTVSGTSTNSVAFGEGTLASGGNTLVSGRNNIVEGTNSFANGDNNSVTGSNSFTSGGNNIVSGDYSTASGYNTTASGDYSTASGYGTTASGSRSTSSGNYTTASGYASTASGFDSGALGFVSHAEGNSTASGDYSHSEGISTTASGDYSHAEGQGNIASGIGSHSEGGDNTASGVYSHSEGKENIASGNYSHTEGKNTTASGNYSHTEGQGTQATGTTSHAEGYLTKAFGSYSHSQGLSTIASGDTSHAEGKGTIASGNQSHAEGQQTTARGDKSHAEGYFSTASGYVSHAEGGNTTASGNYSHSEGASTTASGYADHAQNEQNTASGGNCHAGGFNSTASGPLSFIHSKNSLVTGNRSVVLGGQNLTGATADTVYVPYLNINNINTGTSINNLGIDSSGNVVVGTTGAPSFTGNTSGDCINELWVSSISGCSPVNFGTEVVFNQNASMGSSAGDTGVALKFFHQDPGDESTIQTDADNLIIGGMAVKLESGDSVSLTISDVLSVAGGPTGMEFSTGVGQGFSFSCPTLTGSRSASFQDKTGTVAYMDDLSSVTGFTYSNNNFAISQSGGLSDLVSNISVMTGLTVNGQTTLSGNGQSILTVIGSGSGSTTPLFTVQGDSGELFSITDDLTGSLFAVNDASGLPVLEVFDNDTVLVGSYLAPSLNTTVKSYPPTGLSTIYSLPISAYTGGFFDYTVSNTSGARSGNIMSIFSGTSVQFTEASTTSIGSTTPITFTMSSDGSNASLQVSATTTGWEVKTIVRSI